jgi:CheY-like chemotaxis protein
VELMGGTIGVESAEGSGSTFWFVVPFETQPEGAATPTRCHGADTGIPLPLQRDPSDSPVRLLLAEDEATNHTFIRAILQKFGYQVDLAQNGREALTLLEQHEYAMVLMDCMMPVLDGYEATAVIRDPASSVRNHAIPVIALTANAMREDRDRCLTAGMDDYLAKPLEVSELLAVLQKWSTLSCSASQSSS